MKPCRMVILAPPGGGKGTQTKLLADAYGFIHLSTGDMFRASIAEGGDLGVKVKKCVESGALVPDDLVVDLICERLGVLSFDSSWVLDGFPRTIQQASLLDSLLQDRGLSLGVVVNLQVPDDVILRRIGGRFSCGECGAGYHSDFRKPNIEGVCDVCGGNRLIRRADDDVETAQLRLLAYHDQTAPLLPYYRERGLLHVLDGNLSVDAVFSALQKILGLDGLENRPSSGGGCA